MARQKKNTPVVHEPNVPEQLTAEQETALRVRREAIEKYAPVIALSREFQTHNGYGKISNVNKIRIFDDIRQSKIYKGMPYKDENGNWATVKTIEQFCAVMLNHSYTLLMEESKRLKELGIETYEAMKQMGFTRAQERLIESIGDDNKAIIKQAAEEKNKDAVLGILEEVIARNAKEKEALEKKNSELEKNNAANEKRLNEKILNEDKLNQKISELENPKHTVPWPQRCTEINIEVTNKSGSALELMDHLDTLRDVIQSEQFEQEDLEAAKEMMGVVYYDAIDQMVKRVAELQEACDIVFGDLKYKARPLLQIESPSE